MANPIPKPAKRNKAQREADLILIAEMTLQGMKQSKISTILAEKRPYSLSQQTISKDIKLLEERWREESTRTITEGKNRQLKHLEVLKADAWRCLEASTEPRIVKKQGWRERPGQTPPGGTQGQQTASQAKETFATVEHEERQADPRWHMVLLKALEREAALLGLDAPRATEPDTPPRLQDSVTAVHAMKVMESIVERRYRKKHGLNRWSKIRESGANVGDNTGHDRD
jgi:hypothetical protein